MADVSAYPAYPAYEDHGTDILAALNDTGASEVKTSIPNHSGPIGNTGNTGNTRTSRTSRTNVPRKKSESRKPSYNDDVEEAKRFLEANQAGKIGQQVLERRAKHTEYMQHLLERDPVHSRRIGLNPNAVSPEDHETSNAGSEPYSQNPSQHSMSSANQTHLQGEPRTVPAKLEGGDGIPSKYSKVRTSVPPPGEKNDPQTFAHKFNQFLHRMSWNERQQSYIFSRRYLMRKPSFVVLPDESSKIVSFNSKDMIKEHPKPVVQHIPREPRKNPRYMRPVKKPSLSSMSSINYARNGRYGRSIQQPPSLHSQDWVKISLPVKSRNKRYADDMMRSMRTGSRKTSNGGSSHLPSPLDTPSRSQNNIPHTPESWVTVRSVFPSIHSIPPPAPGASGSRSYLGLYNSPRGQRSARSNRSTRSVRRQHPRSPIKEASVAGLRGQPGFDVLGDELNSFDEFTTKLPSTPQLNQPVQGYALSNGNLTASPTALPSSYRPESWRKSAILSHNTRTQQQSQQSQQSKDVQPQMVDVDVVDEAMEFVDVFKMYLERSLVDRTSRERKKFGLHSPAYSESSLSLSPAPDIVWSSGSESSSGSAGSSPTIGSGLSPGTPSILTVDDVPELESSDRHSIDIADLTPPKKPGQSSGSDSAKPVSPETSSRHTEFSRSRHTVSSERRSLRHSRQMSHHSSVMDYDQMNRRSGMTSCYSSTESLLSAEFMRMTPLVQGVLTDPSGNDVVVGPMPLSQLSNSSQYLDTVEFINGTSNNYTAEPLNSSPKNEGNALKTRDNSVFTLTGSVPEPTLMPEPFQQSLHSDSEVSHSDSASMPESATDVAFESAPEIIRRSVNQRSLRSKRTRSKRHARSTTMDSMWEAEDDDEESLHKSSGSSVPPLPPIPAASSVPVPPKDL